MIRWLYSLLMVLAQPLLRLKMARRARAEPGYGEAVAERWGCYAGAALQVRADAPVFWVHAVSLGETRAAAALVSQLRQEWPGMRLLLTHGTATGREAGRALLQTGDLQVWQPWDTPRAVARFLAHFQPRAGLLMETEVWPNLVAGCAAARVPLCLVNARMSAQSLRKAERLVWLSRPAFSQLAAVWAQTEADAQRLRQLGAPVQGALGNFKFDATPDSTLTARGRAWRAESPAPVILFASSREGEERMLAEIFMHILAEARMNNGPDALKNVAFAQQIRAVRWLIVPRHPQRFDEVATLLAQSGLPVLRRSLWQQGPPAAPADPADPDSLPVVWLGDSVGEMALYYGLADVALLGGSFAPLGGQNLIEAAAGGCPVVMGPHTFNFAEAAEGAIAAGAGVRAADLLAAVHAALALVQPGAALHRERARQEGLTWTLAHRGAVRRTTQALAMLLADTPSPGEATDTVRSGGVA